MTFRIDAVRHLRQIAELKKAHGDSMWHVRAYDRAARSLDDYPYGVTSQMNFTTIPWIGAGIASELEAFAKYGTMTPKFIELMSKVPEGRVAYSTEFKDIIESYLMEVAKLGLAEGSTGRISTAGSVRRGKMWIRDVDLITTYPPEVVRHAFRLTGMEEVYGGDKKIRFVHCATGLEFDIKICPEESWNACLLHSTGSMQNNVHMRSVAKRMGMTLNEYGLFNVETGERVDTNSSEEELYQLLGLEYVEPENR